MKFAVVLFIFTLFLMFVAPGVEGSHSCESSRSCLNVCELLCPDSIGAMCFQGECYCQPASALMSKSAE